MLYKNRRMKILITIFVFLTSFLVCFRAESAARPSFRKNTSRSKVVKTQTPRASVYSRGMTYQHLLWSSLVFSSVGRRSEEDEYIEEFHGEKGVVYRRRVSSPYPDELTGVNDGLFRRVVYYQVPSNSTTNNWRVIGTIIGPIH